MNLTLTKEIKMSIKSPEIEGSVLACLISIGNPLNLKAQNALLKLSLSCFTSVKAKDLYTIISNLFKENKSFEYVCVYDLISSHLEDYLHMYMANHASTANLSGYVDLLIDYQELRRRREILSEALEIEEKKESPSLLIKEMDCCLQQLNRNPVTQETYIKNSVTIAEEFYEKDESKEILIKTNIPNLPPIPNQSLITIAARSGVGKTMFALYMMDEIINGAGKSALYFNLEMAEHVMVQRHAILLGAKGTNAKEQILDKISDISLKNVNYVSRPMITIEEIEVCARMAALKEPLSVIVVDYIGLITSKNKSERNDLQQLNVAKRLATLSLDLNCVVIALTQVNRDFKSRPIGNRCPFTHDAAESMGTVHSSTWWLGIDRPEIDDNEPQWKNVFQIRNRKNRTNGGLFEIDLEFINGRFFDHKPKFFNVLNKTAIA